MRESVRNSFNNDEVDVIGLDIGVYNTKTSTGFICRSVYSNNTKYNVGTKDILELNGVRYQMGVGKLKTEIIKSNRDTLPLMLYAVSNSTSCNNVKLVVGLPQYQLEENKYVNEIKEKFIGKFSFMLNGDNREINVLDITIFPEGMGAYYTIENDLSNKDIVLIDIGGSTFNVLLFSNGEFKKAKTLSFGSLNLLNDVRERVMKLHGGRHSIDDVANYMQRGRVGKTDDKMEYVTELSQPYIDDLKSLLDLEFSPAGVEYYLTGGGVEVFAECIINNLGDVDLICDYLHANAKGFKMIGDVIYG